MSKTPSQVCDYLKQAIGGYGSMDLRPSILTTAKFCRELSRKHSHTEAVADCAHCNLTYAANSLERLVQACTAAAAVVAEQAQQRDDLLAMLERVTAAYASAVIRQSPKEWTQREHLIAEATTLISEVKGRA
jgi:ABC-type transporter Mla subunit MlaD